MSSPVRTQLQTVSTSQSPPLSSFTRETAGADDVKGFADLHSPWLNSPWRRFFELSLAGTTLIVLSPLLVGIAVAIRLTTRGPALFRQKRVGRTGEDFTILKFRTMLLDNEGEARSIFGDRRITRFGRMLRRHKLDELPQLINVVRGDMGLIGPRPKLREHHAIDLHLRPGITGAASVAFAAEAVLLRHIPPAHLEECHRRLITPRKLELDLHYMATATFRTDLRLLCMTLLRAGRYTHLSQIGEWSASAYLPHKVSAFSQALKPHAAVSYAAQSPYGLEDMQKTQRDAVSAYIRPSNP
jgi:lipopolysaccharide/colanic/teichoic acid biosynthesis glycosyltransferase